MSVPVSLEALRDQIAGFGGDLYLITVGAEGAAHVVSVRGTLDGDRVIVGAGRTSRANATTNPAVTMLWPAAPGGDYSLLVDGTAVVDDAAEAVAVAPTRAVLHRVVGADADLPSCVRLEHDTADRA